MIKNIQLKIIIFFLFFIITKIFATQLDLGNKTLALGSAYTAINGDLYSIYSNPAGLYGGNNFDLKLDLLASLNFTGDILYNANQIIETKEKYDQIIQAQQQARSIDITQIAAFFNGIKNLVEINQPGKGLLGQLNGSLGIKIKNFAFSVRNVTNIGLKPSIDPGFSLSTNTALSSAISPISKTLKFANVSNEGIIITTNTLNYPELEDTRNELINVTDWLIYTLEYLGVEIPNDIKNNKEGIANALINLAKDNGVSDSEIRSAVSQLNDPYLQNLIDNFINNIYNSQNSFNNNNSAIKFKGINYTEIALGYSQKVIENLIVGAKLKYLFGKTIYYDFKVFQQQEEIDFKDLQNIENKLIKNVSSIGLDVGAIYKLPIPIIDTNLALAIKNLIEPQFDFDVSEEKLTFQRQLTLGFAIKPSKIFTLGIDCDLNKVKTLVEGYDIKNFSLGLEINPPILPILRLGYLKNLEMNNDQLYTFGLGIKILTLNFDLVCAFNTQETKINKDITLPTNNLSLGITLGMKF